MAKNTIQIADKPTLDAVKALLENKRNTSVISCEFAAEVSRLITPAILVSTLPYLNGFYKGAVVVYNNEIHILGQFGTGSECTEHYKFDGSSWSEVSALPYSFDNGAAVVYNNEIHILGSYTSNCGTKHYKFDGSSWSEVSTLPYSFNSGAAVVYNNEIHILGGNSDANDTTAKHYKFDGSSWSEVSTLPKRIGNGAAVVYNNEIHYLKGGYNFENGRAHYKFDGSKWISVSTLPYSYCAAAVVYNNEIHILGQFGNDSTQKHYKFDGSSWSEVSTLPHPFSGAAVVYNNEIHILGGTVSNDEDRKKHCKFLRQIYKQNEPMYLPKDTKIYSAYELMSISNCSLETTHLVVTEDGNVSFAVLTDGAKSTITLC